MKFLLRVYLLLCIIPHDALGKNPYESLLPDAKKLDIKSDSKPDLSKILAEEFNGCIAHMNLELTHRRDKSSKSGGIAYQVFVENLKIEKIELAYDQLKDFRVRECIEEKFKAYKMDSHYSRSSYYKNVCFYVSCKFQKEEKYLTSDGLHRRCKILPNC